MKKTLIFFSQLFMVLIVAGQTVKKQYPDIDFPYKKFVLDSGLRLIVHEDHKVPIAAL